MTLESMVSIALTVLTVVLAPVAYIWRGVMQRLNVLEEEVKHKVTENEVRLLLIDKLEPIKQDVQSLDRKLDTIIEHLLNKK